MTKKTQKSKKIKPPKKPVTAIKKPTRKVPKPEVEVKPASASAKAGRYFQAIGRRKESVAVVRLSEDMSSLSINGKSIAVYFPWVELQKIVAAPIAAVGLQGKIGGTIKASGGGLRGQAEAARLGIARALIEFNREYRTRLKNLGYLTRDARVKERKKYGLKGARRAPQWQKR